MELRTIEKLIDAYFEGDTSLQEEQQLKTYFTQAQVPDHLAPYKALFEAQVKASQEKYTREIVLPKKVLKIRWMPYAAAIAACVGLFLFFNPTMKQEDYGTYQDPEVAALKAKQALFMISNEFNQGAEQLNTLNEIENIRTKFLK